METGYTVTDLETAIASARNEISEAHQTLKSLESVLPVVTAIRDMTGLEEGFRAASISTLVSNALGVEEVLTPEVEATDEQEDVDDAPAVASDEAAGNDEEEA